MRRLGDLPHPRQTDRDSAHGQPQFASVTPGDPKAGLSIHTFLGTPVATHIVIGRKRHMGFGFKSYRRAVDCRIFGTRYVGWFMESSGDYCKLRKAKVQGA